MVLNAAGAGDGYGAGTAALGTFIKRLFRTGDNGTFSGKSSPISHSAMELDFNTESLVMLVYCLNTHKLIGEELAVGEVVGDE